MVSAPSREWPENIKAFSRSVIADIPRIRAILDELGIPNADFADPRDFVVQALNNADAAGMHWPFVMALIKTGLIKKGDDPLEGKIFRQMADLQAMSSAVYRPTDVLVAVKRLLLATEVVCMIDVDDTHGTGVLVAPTLIATAAHVVQSLVQIANGTAVPVGDSTGRIHVTFGHVVDLLDDNQTSHLPGTKPPLAADWLAYYSPPAPQEISGNGFVLDSIEGIGERGPWDLAILRLAEPLSSRPLAASKHLSRRPFQVHVLHHPDDARGKGLPMLWSVGRIDGRLGEPPLRVLHSASTTPGSSGAPLLDTEFHLVGLHQAGAARVTSADDEVCNRAVPAARWFELLTTLEAPAEIPLLKAIDITAADGTKEQRTIIGRHETQRRIWQAMRPDAPPTERLLVVLDRPGLGLRSTKHIVRSMVTKAGAAFGSIDVTNSQSDDAEAFAGRISGALGEEGRRKRPSGLTTVQRESRNRTAPVLAAKLEKIARGGGAWLVLEGFESVSAGSAATVVDVVRQLVEELPRMPGVRLVLVGWQESLPPGFQDSIEYLNEPEWQDIAWAVLPTGLATDERVASLRPLVAPAFEAKLQSARFDDHDVWVLAEQTHAELEQTLVPFIRLMIPEGSEVHP